MVPRITPMSYWLRTGRVIPADVLERKFNPNHDPKNGQFTNRPGGATSAQRKPNRRGTVIQDSVRTIPGYPQTGKDAWRAANDKVFIDAVNNYNAKHGYMPGNPQYWTVDLLKAQAMVESGGDKAAFLRDPLQVNVPGDWKKGEKAKYTDLTGPHQPMTPALSASAALDWLTYKGSKHDDSGKVLYFRGIQNALLNYNGRTDISPKWGNVEHRLWYANRVIVLAKAVSK